MPPSAPAQAARVEPLLARIERWLQAERRLVERSTGEPLARAYFVRVAGGRVAEVLMQGGGRDDAAAGAKGQ